MLRHRCSKLLRRTEAEDQRGGAAESCKQQLFAEEVFCTVAAGAIPHQRDSKKSNKAVREPKFDPFALLLHEKNIR